MITPYMDRPKLKFDVSSLRKGTYLSVAMGPLASQGVVGEPVVWEGSPVLAVSKLGGDPHLEVWTNRGLFERWRADRAVALNNTLLDPRYKMTRRGDRIGVRFRLGRQGRLAAQMSWFLKIREEKEWLVRDGVFMDGWVFCLYDEGEPEKKPTVVHVAVKLPRMRGVQT